MAGHEDAGGERFGWRAFGATLALHTIGLTAATWPMLRTFPARMMLNEDSVGSLWLLRWSRACLFEGQSPWYCTEVMYPVGVPMGFFTPMYLQSLIFSVCSLAVPDDAVCWNVLWLIGVLGTGMGTTLLAWHLVGDRASAAFAGLLAMLGTPVAIVSNVQLELTYVGAFPLFLLAWMRFVDRPGVSRLLLATLSYLLVATTCGYYMVFSVFPAALYLAWAAAREGVRPAWSWLYRRSAWLAAMGTLTLACLLVVYSAQVWALVKGYNPQRSRSELEAFSVPLWSYVVPTPYQRLGGLIPVRLSPYWSTGVPILCRMYYLGAVTIGLMVYAAAGRARLRRASYVWSAFALMIVLSLGASWTVAGRTVTLPSGWLWSVFPPIRMTRVISRFGIFAVVLGGVIASAGLCRLLSRLPGRAWRAAAFATLAAAAVLDLSLTIRFPRGRLPEAPGCYAFLQSHAPRGPILEIADVRIGQIRNAFCTYWQSHHRLTTSAGISGVVNHEQDGKIFYNSPFLPPLMDQPSYLNSPSSPFALIHSHGDFREYLWVYLTVNGFDYVVMHKVPVPIFGDRPPRGVDRVGEVLRECRIYDDPTSAVFARSRLRPPAHPVAINRDAWNHLGVWEGRLGCMVPESTRVAVYNPEPGRAFQLVMDATGVYTPVTVRLRSGEGAEVARWDVEPGGYRECVSPPIRCAVGLNDFTIESRPRDRIGKANAAIDPLCVARLSARPEPEPERKPLPVAVRDRSSPSARDTSRR